MSAAPSNVVSTLDVADAWIIGVVGGSTLWAARQKRNRIGLDVPVQRVVTPANVQMREAIALLYAKYADKTVTKVRHRAVVDSLHARGKISTDNRIAHVAPDDFLRPSRPRLPWNRRPCCRPTLAGDRRDGRSPTIHYGCIGTSSRRKVVFHGRCPAILEW